MVRVQPPIEVGKDCGGDGYESEHAAGAFFEKTANYARARVV